MTAAIAPVVSSARAPLGAVRAVLYGGLVVGLADITDAFVYFGLKGATPMRILQSIASGVLGRETARAGGWGTASVGVLVHFSIATSIVLTYFLVSRKLLLLTRYPVACGIAYGVVAYLMMNLVFVPLSRATPGAFPPPLPILANGVLIHMFGIGLPAALFVRRADAGTWVP